MKQGESKNSNNRIRCRILMCRHLMTHTALHLLLFRCYRQPDHSVSLLLIYSQCLFCLFFLSHSLLLIARSSFLLTPECFWSVLCGGKADPCSASLLFLLPVKHSARRIPACLSVTETTRQSVLSHNNPCRR